MEFFFFNQLERKDRFSSNVKVELRSIDINYADDRKFLVDPSFLDSNIAGRIEKPNLNQKPK